MTAEVAFRHRCLSAVIAYANEVADKIESGPQPPEERLLKDLETCELLLRVLPQMEEASRRSQHMSVSFDRVLAAEEEVRT